MDHTPLNTAHNYRRKAMDHTKANRYTEAIECHQLAADNLDKAIIEISKRSPGGILQSLVHQRDYHLEYKKMMIRKNAHFKKYICTMERLRIHKNDEDAAKLGQSACKIENSIYRIIDKSDILMEKLIEDTSLETSNAFYNNKNAGCSNSTSNSSINVSTSSTSASTISINSTSSSSTGITKNDNQNSQESLLITDPSTKTVVSKLQALNEKLHVLVCRLMSTLDEYILNSEELREQIKHLEEYKGKPGEVRPPTEKELKEIGKEMNATANVVDTTAEYDNVAAGGVAEKKDSDKKKYSREFMAQYNNLCNMSSEDLEEDSDFVFVRGGNSRAHKF